MKLSDLAGELKAELIGDGDMEIRSISTLHEAGAEDVSFVSEAKFAAEAARSRAGALLVGRDVAVSGRAALLRVEDVNAALERALELFAPPPAVLMPGIHPTAVVATSAQVADSASVGPHVVIGENTVIGAGSVLTAGCVIGRDVRIGADCRLGANVVVNERCFIGDRVIIHPNATVGADGFGYRLADGCHRKIPHIGIVVIDDDVEIGANSCVDRAKFGRTVVGRGTKIDNLVQVAHNVQVGRHCILVSQTGIAGSAVLEDYVVLGGQVGVRDHVRIGKGAMVAATSAVERDIEPGEKMVGTPARPVREFFRRLALWEKLPELAQDIKKLKRRME